MQSHRLDICSTRYLAILLMAILSVCACTHRPVHEPQFRRARAVMDSCPERALTILDSIPAADLRPGLDSARYILLHALAENKAHRLSTSDSLLRSIIPVFQRYKLKDDLRTANYILGTSLDYQERYPEAIGYLIDAEYLIDVSTDPYQKGLIYNELAECCNATLNGDLAMKYIRLAYDAFKTADKPLHAAYALHDRATFLNNNAQYEAAATEFKKVKLLADSLNNDNLGYAASMGIGYSCFGSENFEEALRYFRKIPSGVEAMDSQGIAIWAETEKKAGNPYVADSLARILMERGDYRWIYAVDLSTVTPEEVVTASQQQDEVAVKAYLDTYRDKFPTAVERNFILKEDLSGTHLKYNRIILICMAVLVIILTAYSRTLITAYRRRLKEKEDTLLALSKDFISFSREQRYLLEKATSQRKDAISVTESMMRQRIALLRKLTYSYYGRPPDSNDTLKDITVCVKQLIKDLRTDKKTFDELERVVNVCHDNVLERLKTERPDLEEEELRLFTYVASGLDNHILMEVYEVDSVVFRKRKSRLKAKLSSPFTPSQNLYIRFF